MVIVQFYGRPFATPPAVPVARIAALREAFAQTFRDQAFLEEAEKGKLEIRYLTARDVRH